MNGINGRYETEKESFTYTGGENSNFTLTPKDGSTPFMLIIFDQHSFIMYRDEKTPNIPNSHNIRVKAF